MKHHGLTRKRKISTKVTETFLYYARAVGPAKFVALILIASEQTALTQRTMDKTLFSWVMLQPIQM